MNIKDCDGIVLNEKFPLTIETGFNKTETMCLPNDLTTVSADYTVSVGGGPWTSEISWQIVGPSGSTWLEDTGEAIQQRSLGTVACRVRFFLLTCALPWG